MANFDGTFSNTRREEQMALSNKFECLRHEEDNKELEEAWQQVATVIEEAATETIGKKKNRPKRRWLDRECGRSAGIENK